MNIIYGPRNCGKTTQLIELAEERMGHIICNTAQEAERTFNIATMTGRKIQRPLTFDALLEMRYYGDAIDEFYIDNVDMLLHQITRVPIYAMTMSDFDGDLSFTQLPVRRGKL